ncbi:MAG: hypothetical protein N2515_10295, partial [Deltaproteobacteria bacterium]|nr:hypothetical protein [Deltaproteobacteria bacterium]
MALALPRRTHMLRLSTSSLFWCSLFALSACVNQLGEDLDNELEEDIDQEEAALSRAQRRARATLIRDVARRNGLRSGFLLAGIADAETQLAHCWSELRWACQGPHSADCNGPVVAGAGDGPCHLREGGLGMFQFDAGDHDDTLRREGRRILSLEGNIEAAIDFVIDMVIRSPYISGVSTRAQAIEWMNGVRIDNDRFRPWIQTVTHLYNGCAPEYSSYRQRYARYRDYTVQI